MKVVILAGGKGTRITEESQYKPKPMIEIGDMPILWHIMKIYSHYGCNDFIICCGYKGYMIKEYFANYYLRTSDITFDFTNNGDIKIHNSISEPWKVTLIDTGAETMTGGRIRRIQTYIPNGETFLMTYGDGVSNVNIQDLINFHKKNKKVATMTVVQPGGRYGAVEIQDDGTVNRFVEKPQGDGGWINAGFFVLDYEIFDYLKDDSEVFEKQPLETLAENNGLIAYKHTGYWQSMDSMRDRTILQNAWIEGVAPWKIW
ncbi:MAG: glucose-1-phosphate cytidylyltransferase [Lachnospiraceae bacterium]|nr:glucose-1-phosphate cytidylyltransferase [Lachnospiraceae bacterium]